MYRTVLGILFCVIIAWSADSLLTVSVGQPISYESGKDERFSARYGQLSDGTLHFVKVTLPDGHEYTLPQVFSASGARYTDDRDLVWWEHQGTVRLDVRTAAGKWETKYQALKRIDKRP
jgi:membrane-bound inhibitor of C-type lysozyme